MRWGFGLQKLRGLEVDEAICSELDAAGGFQAGDSLIQQAKQARGTVGVNRRADGLCWCDIRRPRYLRQQRGGTQRDDKERDEQPLQMPIGKKRKEVATLAAVSTERCSKAPGVHRRGSDHNRPCSVHCQSTVVVFGWFRSSPLPTILRTASQIGKNLSERGGARALC